MKHIRVYVLFAFSFLVLYLAASAPAGAQTKSLAGFSDELERLAATVAPAVVQVQVSAWCPPTDDKNPAVLTPGQIVGSGVIVDPSGYIITNEHVVRNARRIRVMLTPESKPESLPAGEPRVLEAVLVGTNHDTDLALLKVDASGLPTIPIRATSRAHQGQVVLAVGSPGGLDNTITLGIVSAVGRQPSPGVPMVYIQTDAAINPGNSGGPLLDVAGNLIGINALILSKTGGNEGLGFAVPAPVVRYVYEQLRSHGTVRRSVIGVNMQTITPALAQGLDLGQAHGVIIADVLPGAPAARTGLRSRDIVTQVDGTPVPSLPYFVATMYLHDPAKPVAMTVLRGRDTLHFSVTAISADDRDNDDFDGSPDLPDNVIGELGIFGKTVTPALASRFHLRSTAGIYVIATTTESDDSDTGFVTGDVIVALNETPVLSVQQLRLAMDRLPDNKAVVVQVERHSQFRFLTLSPE